MDRGRSLALLALVFLCGLSGGCASRRLAYRWADWFLVRQVDSLFGLSGQQKSFVRARIAALHAWHRREELPRYLVALDRFRGQFAAGFQPADIQGLTDEVETAGQRLADHLAPVAGTFLSTLRPEQIAQAERELSRAGTERFVYLDRPAEEYVKRARKEGERAMKQWTGDVTRDQLALLDRFFRDNRGVRLRRRDRFKGNVQEFVAALRQKPPAPVLADLTRTWMTREEVHETPEFQRSEKQSEQDFLALFMNLYRSLTPDQKKHLLAELATLHDDLADLVADK